MIPTIENILKALFAGDMDVATASRYIATHIELAERRAAVTPPTQPALPPVARLPLTEEGMHALILSIPHNGRASDDIGYVTDIARAIEKAHLIGIEASTGEQS